MYYLIQIRVKYILTYCAGPVKLFYHAPGALAIGIYFLLIPGYRLYSMKTRLQAARLFNRASYYPLAILVMVAALMLWF